MMARSNSEQERKFLLPLRFDIRDILPVRNAVGVAFQQPYIGNPLMVDLSAPRLRIKQNDSVCEITSKRGLGVRRDELTERFDLESALKLQPFFNLPLLKYRYVYAKTDDYEIVIDVYAHEYIGIAVLEVEWYGAECPSLPEQLTALLASGEAVEVTGRWSNVDLATMSWAARLSKPEHVWEYLALEPVPMIAFEGGPVSGKDSILEEFAKLYEEDCYVIPEVATSLILAHGKYLPKSNNYIWNGILQSSVCVMQTLQERWAQIIARRAGHKVIFVNRGRLSNAVFMDGGVETLLQLTGLSFYQEAERYAKIIQLEVAPAEHYDEHVRRNLSRTESHVQAVEQEVALQQLFGNCPNYFFVPNRESGMASKVSDVMREIQMLIPGFGGGACPPR